MIEMLLSAFCFVLAAIGWPGFNQKEKMLATDVAIVCLERQGPGEESRENGRPCVTVTVGPAIRLTESRSCAQPFRKQNSLFPPTCPQQYAGKPGACYLRNIMLINVLRCWTFPLPVL